MHLSGQGDQGRTAGDGRETGAVKVKPLALTRLARLGILKPPQET